MARAVRFVSQYNNFVCNLLRAIAGVAVSALFVVGVAGLFQNSQSRNDENETATSTSTKASTTTTTTTNVPTDGKLPPVLALTGKVCVCFGDSITGNMTAPDDYPSVLAEKTGMTVINAGFGGCRMSDTHPTEAYAAFSMVKLAEAVADGDWSLQDEFVNDISPSTNGVEHLAMLKTVDWSRVDYITIFYGTNDIRGWVDLEDTQNPNNTKTGLGALRYSIEKIQQAYPNVQIILLTPIYRYFIDKGLDSDEITFGNVKFTDWVDGVISVGQEYDLPYLDMYRQSGINALNKELYLNADDGVHPTQAGQRLIGEKLADYFMEKHA